MENEGETGGRTVDLRKLSEAVEGLLARTYEDFERTCDINERGGAWLYRNAEGVSGFVSCETNEEDVGIPSVTITIHVGDIADYSREELTNLLIHNGKFLQASLTAAEWNGRTMLFLERRVPAVTFRVQDVEGIVSELIRQADLFMKE